MRLCCWFLMYTIPVAVSAQEAPVVPAPPAEITTSPTQIDSWAELDAVRVQEILEDALAAAALPSTQGLLTALNGQPIVTVVKTIPPRALTPDGLPQDPYLLIRFSTPSDVIPSPEAPRLAGTFVRDVLSRSYFSPEFMTALTVDMRSGDGWISPRYLQVLVNEGTPVWNPFRVPLGLSMPWRELAYRLGYLPPCSTVSIAFTPDVCRNMAIKAIYLGYYYDAIALVDHAQSQLAALDSSLLYLKAYCQITLGLSDRAAETLAQMKTTTTFPYHLQERLNGPAAVYLREALKY